MEEISEALRKEIIRRNFSDMGKKGGASGKGTIWRREVCRHAAKVRWRIHRERNNAEALEANQKRKAERAVRKLERIEAQKIAAAKAEQEKRVVSELGGGAIGVADNTVSTDNEIPVKETPSEGQTSTTLTNSAVQQKDEEAEAIRRALLA